MNVKHDIVLELQNDADFEDEYDNYFEKIQAAVSTLDTCTGSGEIT